jgi:FkbM family methyltransferase
MISLARRVAQRIRHHPGLGPLEPLWPLLRRPYLACMTFFGESRGISVTIAGCEMRLNPLFCTQNWETVETEAYNAFAAEIRPGSTVFDVGAHIGTYTLIALQRAGPKGRVVAYEPHDHTRAHLAQHLRWNAAENRTTVRTVCCGAVAGIADFYCITDRAEGMNGLIPIEGFVKRAVTVVPLDQEVKQHGLLPNVIKIDVEGAELDVLKGAEQTLRRSRPPVFLSLHPSALAKRNESPEMIFVWLKQRGYRYEVISEDHEIHVIARAIHAV